MVYATQFSGMHEAPGPDDRLGLRLTVAWSKVAGGYRGALGENSTGRWSWECLHEPHGSRDAAVECAREEIRKRRKGLGH